MKNKMPAKLIQSNDGFNLFNLVEIRSFIEDLNLYDSVKIPDTCWNHARNLFTQKYKNSSTYDFCNNLFADFQNCNPKDKYYSDFEFFIKESKLEDFVAKGGETINVSTIHKAKGKEFDNVFLLLDNYEIRENDKKRVVYVAITRAKSLLEIHTNQSYFDENKPEGIENLEGIGAEEMPLKIVMQAEMRDVNLSFFKKRYNRNSTPVIAGDEIYFEEDPYQNFMNDRDEQIGATSRRFYDKLKNYFQKGYEIEFEASTRGPRAETRLTVYRSPYIAHFEK